MGIPGRSALLLSVVLVATASAHPALGQVGGGSSAAVTGMQGALLADPASREQVLSLQDDPQVKAILDDPQTMRAVQSGDLGALMSDPKVRALLGNPTVRSLVDQQSR